MCIFAVHLKNNTKAKYHSITFQPRYQDKSFEELRSEFITSRDPAAGDGRGWGEGEGEGEGEESSSTAILDLFLSNKELRPVVTELVSITIRITVH